MSELMEIKSGSGRKTKTADVEGEIIAEIESNNYHTRQEIADMIEEKFHLKISRSSVGRLLKKRHQMAEMWFHPRQSGRGQARKLFPWDSVSFNGESNKRRDCSALFGCIAFCNGM